jgi:membrane-associated phospholipid phosphatase
MTFFTPTRLLALVAIIGLTLSACKDQNTPGVNNDGPSPLVASFTNKVVYDWNQKFLEIERNAQGYRPGPAPRALAYIGLSNYEACITSMPTHNSLASLYPGLTIPPIQLNQEYHWPTVINASYANLMRLFFGNMTAEEEQSVNDLEAQLNNQYRNELNSQEVFDRSVSYGKAVSNAVWDWSATDPVGHNAYPDPFANYDWQAEYDAPGDWVPTSPGPGKPMFPRWGNARRFAITLDDRLCPAPLPYSEDPGSAFYNQALENVIYTAGRPYESEWIGEFWSDDLMNLTFSPGPRWTAIADQIMVLEESNLEFALELNAKMGMALNDAAVACWHSKYFYNVERPESYIKRVIDPNFEPILDHPYTGQVGISPSFPAYPSGHSTMGGAGAEVLADMYGTDYTFTDNCHAGRPEFEGTPRTFTSFYKAADENAWSRVLLGVHYRMDCTEGVELGYRCAYKVNRLPWRK